MALSDDLLSGVDALSLVDERTPNPVRQKGINFLCHSYHQRLSNIAGILLTDEATGVYYRQYRSEDDLHEIMALISKDLSEPYSIYTYRYFIYNWPTLCILVSMKGIQLISIRHSHKKMSVLARLSARRMFVILATLRCWRWRKDIGDMALVGSALFHHVALWLCSVWTGTRIVQLAIDLMIASGCTQVSDKRFFLILCSWSLITSELLLSPKLTSTGLWWLFLTASFPHSDNIYSRIRCWLYKQSSTMEPELVSTNAKA